MEIKESNIERIAERVSEKRIQLFKRLLRQNLVNAGVDETLFDNAAQSATLELKVQEPRVDIISDALRNIENRGMDTVGRIVVEYCFVRSASGKMIWPEFSDEDTMARWQFTDSVLPRPLMRYFLVSVRGSIEEIDGFSSESFLFDSKEEIESLRQTIGDLIDDFKGPFGSGESAVDWQEVYEDARFQELALDIVTKMRKKMNDSGLEAYLDQLETYHQQDPKSEEANLMQRPFTLEDAEQIDHALESAEVALKEKTH